MRKSIIRFAKKNRKLITPALAILCMAFLAFTLFLTVSNFSNAEQITFYASDFVNDPALGYMNAVFDWGSYPQTRVPSGDLLTALNGISASNNTTVTYEDERYFKKNTGEFYKYEPITWRILTIDKTNRQAFAVSEFVLDVHEYDNQLSSDRKWSGTPTIRSWMYDTFIPRAFTADEKSKLVEKMYPLWTGGVDGTGINDTVAMLSYHEIGDGTAIEFGFASTWNSEAKGTAVDGIYPVTTEYTNRLGFGTDYALSFYGYEKDRLQLEGSPNNNKIAMNWWTRSRNCTSDSHAVIDGGHIDSNWQRTMCTWQFGVRPAMTIDFSTLDDLTVTIRQVSPRNTSATDTKRFVGYSYDGGALTNTIPTEFSFDEISKVKAYFDNGTKYQISFDPNGGETNLSSNVQEVLLGESLTLPNVSKTGYTFTGWYNSSDVLVGSAGESYTPTESETLHASWLTPIYEVTLNNRNADFSGDTNFYVKYNEDTFQDLLCTEQKRTITIPEKTGYTFEGYFTKTNGEGSECVDAYGNITTVPLSFIDDTTLYAWWKPEPYLGTTFYAKDFVNDPTLGYLNATFTYAAFPQSKVQPGDLLNALDGLTYSNGEVFDYGGAKYLKVDAGIYFKYEPVVWRILSITDTEVFALSEFVIDVTNWDNQIAVDNKWSETIPANIFLNNNVLNSIFTASEQNAIVEKIYALGPSRFDGSGTFDKVSFLSYDDLTGENGVKYGFLSDENQHEYVNTTPSNGVYTIYSEKSNRVGYATDFALYKYPNYNKGRLDINWPNYDKYSIYYWTRSRVNGGTAKFVDITGGLLSNTDTPPTVQLGSRPVITLKLSELSDKYITVRQALPRNYDIESLFMVGYSYDGGPIEETVPSDLKFNNIKKLKAYFTDRSKYYISFDANGGSNGNSANISEVTASTKVVTPTPIREGYICTGWYADDSDGFKRCNAGDTYTPWKSEKLYAHWELPVYTIVLDSQSADTNGTTNFYVKYSDTNYSEQTCTNEITTITVPEKTGYTFGGYYTAENGGGIQYIKPSGLITSIGTTFTKDSTLYAKWSLNTYQISYNLDGGSVSSNNPLQYNVNSNTINISNPSKVGYTFSGWTEGESQETSLSVSIPSGSTGNKNYAAHYIPNTNTRYTINHYLMNVDGTYSIKDTEKLTGTTDAEFTLLDLTKTYNGYTYLRGKASDPSTTCPVEADKDLTTTILPDGSRVINLYYERNSHAVSLTKGSGINLVSGGGTYYFGERVTISASTLAGYKFTGWTGDYSSNKVEYSFEMPDSNVSLTANAEIINYEIKYYLNEGTVSTFNPVTYNVTSGDITLNNPQRAGYNFEGWSGTDIPNHSTQVTIPSGSTGDRTYFASWVLDTVPIYNITYDLDGGDDPHNQIIYNETQPNFKLANPVKKGFIFAGWTGSNGLTPEMDVTIPFGSTGDKNFTAHWTPIKINVIIDGDTNGGSSSPSGELQIDFATETSKTLTITVNTDFKADVFENDVEKATLASSGSYIINNLDTLRNNVTVRIKFTSTKTSGGGGGGGGTKIVKVIEQVPVVTQKETVVYKPYVEGYKDGTFRPKENVSREEVATIVARTLKDFDESKDYTSSNTFNDSKSRWSKNYLGFCIQKDLFHGYQDGTLRPNSPMTRGELATLVSNIIDSEKIEWPEEDKKEITFPDVKGKWYEKEVTRLASLGILNGYEDGTFKGQNNVTRVEMVIVMNKLISRNSLNEISYEDIRKVAKMFKDVDSDAWYFKDVALATIEHQIEVDVNPEKEDTKDSKK